jgi:hypothetical protein
VPDRERSSELGLQAALQSRMRPADSLSLILRISVATTLSYLLAKALSGSALPVFAPITTLFVVQSSLFSSLGITAQRVLGTGLGVAAATVYVTWVPVTWWSVFLAVFASLLVARALPVGLAGQLQIPVAVVFVLALGHGDPSADLWRVLDVGLGAIVGLAAVVIAPPRPRLDEARAALSAYQGDMVALLRAVADEAGALPAPLDDDTRHGFVALSRALRDRATAGRDAVATAEESVRLNPRARAVGSALDGLHARMLWLSRLAIHIRSLVGSIDRLYDRPDLAPALPRTMLATLLRDLAVLLDTDAEEEAHGVSERMSEDIRLAVEVTAGSGDVVAALGSLTLLGRLEQLRDAVVTGPSDRDSIDGSREGVEDESDDSSASATDRLRRLLGRSG